MSAFLIAQVKVTDPAWIPDYAAKVHDIAARHGGRYLSRSPNVTRLEGEAPDVSLVAIIQFPDVASAQAFATDPDYARFVAARQAGSVRHLYVHDAADAAGAIPYLPKAG